MQERQVAHVMVGVLPDGRGRVLVARRPAGKHMAGRWEFPGGKLHDGETPLAGLRRELAEELGVTLESAEPLIRLRHDYHDRGVLLDVWRVTRFEGTPRGLDGQPLDWLPPDELPRIDLLEADRPIVTALRLPPVARCATGIAGLAAASGRVRPETLCWKPGGADAAAAETREAVRAAQRRGHRVLVAGESVEAATVAAATGADGMLLEPSRGRFSLDPDIGFLAGALCPTPAAAQAAVAAGAHFLILTPDGARPSLRHLAGLLETLGVPAFLGWYPDDGSLELARSTGAHGCVVGPFDRAGN